MRAEDEESGVPRRGRGKAQIAESLDFRPSALWLDQIQLRSRQGN